MPTKKKEGKSGWAGFESPINAPKPGKDPGPAVDNIPVTAPGDPLGVIPGGPGGKTKK